MSQRHAVHDATGVIASNDGGDIIIASGGTKPTDGVAGYSTGCIFIDTDTTGIACVTVNIGTNSSADFNVVTVAS
jgi:hypothetical protein